MSEDWKTIVDSLRGKPFKWGTRGPDEYDCWGIVLAVFDALGKDLPGNWLVGTEDNRYRRLQARVIINSESSSYNWMRVEKEIAKPGDVVAMSPNGALEHVGVLTPFGILHANEKHGAQLAKRESDLRNEGYQRIEYYRWAG